MSFQLRKLVMLMQHAFNPDIGDIGHSLRHRANASTYLSWTPSVAGNRKTWTWSGWVKRGKLDSGSNDQIIFSGRDSSNNLTVIGWYQDQLNFSFFSGGVTGAKRSSVVYRDTTTHYHVVVVCDTTNATASERIRLYVDGVRITSFSSSVDPSLNYDAPAFNTTNPHGIGFVSTWPTGAYLDGYQSRLCFIDGQALDPSSFGYMNTQINRWVTKSQSQIKAVVDAGGANSFMLDFDNGTSLTTLGYDKSAKGNNWTLNNFSLTGTTYDWMDDKPGDNCATFNPLTPARANTYDGNLRVSGGDRYSITTLGMPSGVWWATFKVNAVGGNTGIGIATAPDVGGSPPGNNAWSMGYNFNAVKYGPSGASASYGTTYTSGDTIGVRLDATNNTVEFFKQTGSTGLFVSQGVVPTGLAGTYYFAVEGRTSSGTNDIAANFGQQPLSDATWLNGAKSLRQANLPTPKVLNPRKHFDIRTRAGTGASYSVTDLLFAPDFYWGKSRTNAYDHKIVDRVRGANKPLVSNSTSAELTETQGLMSFDASGYTLGTSSDSTINNAGGGQTYVDWLLKAGGAPVANNAGSITSQVSANTEAGFSIVAYRGTGANATVGHGLPVAPRMIVVKSKSSGSLYVYTKDVGAGYYLVLNQTSAATSSSTVWNNTVPTSAVFSLGASASNVSGEDFIAYCFADNRDLPGGIFRIWADQGNASSDGTYSDTGGKVRWHLRKCSTNTYGWTVYDTARSPTNPAITQLYPHSNAAESSDASYAIDYTSQGVKQRSSSVVTNGTETYINLAIVDICGKYS